MIFPAHLVARRLMRNLPDISPAWLVIFSTLCFLPLLIPFPPSVYLFPSFVSPFPSSAWVSSWPHLVEAACDPPLMYQCVPWGMPSYPVVWGCVKILILQSMVIGNLILPWGQHHSNLGLVVQSTQIPLVQWISCPSSRYNNIQWIVLVQSLDSSIQWITSV